ncbi:hypothetical protein TrVE_jg6957 [Triparma verrucosa]|uniref:Protein YIPF n=2 Tax=Triparma TaxID=722752 RepID=A0A9W7AFP0_9STRA|nr:hypothetical protein TrST_g3218 [Triparma strigata]GMH88459.1 hypothetical protein TrVE_jg6957 [Triparma verrucosa]
MGEQVLQNVMFSDSAAPSPAMAPQFRNPNPGGSSDGWYSQQQQQQQQQYGQPQGAYSAPQQNSGPNGPNVPSSYNPNFVSQGLSGSMSSTPVTSSAAGEDFDNEPPLLEELGINIEHIALKTKAIMTPLQAPDSHLYDDTDMAGPLCFALLLGVTLMLTGKLHFGYIYGFGVFGCLALSGVVNLMHPTGVDTWRCFSILGYSLVPVNILAVIAIVISLKGFFGLLLGCVTIGWSTFASVRVFDKCLNMRDQRWLVAYPIALLYSCFVMITVF